MLAMFVAISSSSTAAEGCLSRLHPAGFGPLASKPAAVAAQQRLRKLHRRFGSIRVSAFRFPRFGSVPAFQPRKEYKVPPGLETIREINDRARQEKASSEAVHTALKTEFITAAQSVAHPLTDTAVSLPDFLLQAINKAWELGHEAGPARNAAIAELNSIADSLVSLNEIILAALSTKVRLAIGSPNVMLLALWIDATEYPDRLFVRDFVRGHNVVGLFPCRPAAEWRADAASMTSINELYRRAGATQCVPGTPPRTLVVISGSDRRYRIYRSGTRSIRRLAHGV